MAEVQELGVSLRESGVERGLHIDAIDDAALLSLVEQGLGVSILPAASLKNHSDQIAVLELTPAISRTLGMACRENLSTDVKAFIAFAKDHMMDTV